MARFYATLGRATIGRPDQQGQAVATVRQPFEFFADTWGTRVSRPARGTRVDGRYLTASC
jgi:hypothetical protein